MSYRIHNKASRLLRNVLHRFLVVVGAAGLTLIFFMVLPLMQTLSKPPDTDLQLHTMDTAQLEPPPPPPEEEEPEEEPEPEEKPPELAEETQPLDIAQMEMLLNQGLSGGLVAGDFALKLNTAMAESEDLEQLFSIADLDQKPRVVYQPGPMIGKAVRKKAPGTAYIVFIVNKDGRVENPIVQKSTDSVFNKPALDAVKKWKFEPGQRNGKPVRFRMRVPITFPKDN
ncbi:energy transducer TonB [Candidatus Sumerlaeota bacterium]|nr:energy transducer TonB [Candidatus Sumerlaeota bacterium]